MSEFSWYILRKEWYHRWDSNWTILEMVSYILNYSDLLNNLKQLSSTWHQRKWQVRSLPRSCFNDDTTTQYEVIFSRNVLLRKEEEINDIMVGINFLYIVLYSPSEHVYFFRVY